MMDLTRFHLLFYQLSFFSWIFVGMKDLTFFLLRRSPEEA